jgi:4-methyl-5(b-hydroxyethyl)-thiazole monophosphate biosynthesis
MTGLFLFSDNMEDSEAIMTRDLLLRSGLKIVSASFSSLYVTTSYGVQLKTDSLVKDLDLNQFDFLVVPGGKYVSQTIKKCLNIQELLLDFYNNKKLICLVCAAPMFLNNTHILDNKKYTCYDGCEKEIKEGTYVKQNVVNDNKVITSRGVGTLIDFSVEIINCLLGKDASKRVLDSILYTK